MLVPWWALGIHVITVCTLEDSSEVRPVAYFLVVNGSRHEVGSLWSPVRLSARQRFYALEFSSTALHQGELEE